MTAHADAAQREQPTGLPASAWLLVEESSGDVLAAEDPRSPYPVASATKLMTALIALRELEPDDRAVAAPYSAVAGESLMGLEAGQAITVRDLLYGLLVASGNDAAVTLATRVSGSVPDFVTRMNGAADRLGLRQTTYVDPIGIDGGNVSSARDLVELSLTLRDDPLFRRIVDTERVAVGAGAARERLVNRNTLVLDVPWVNGVKTGTTLDAGYVLVASARRRGIDLVSAVIGAPGELERDAATLELLTYGASLYERRTLVAAGERLAGLDLGDGRGVLPLVAGEEVLAVARTDQEVEVEYEPPAPPDAAVTRGQPFGEAAVTLDGRTVAAVELVAGRAAPASPAAGAAGDGLPAWTVAVLVAAGVLAAALAGRAIAIARRPSR